MDDHAATPRRPTRLKSERVQGEEPRPTRLKSERVQGEEPRPSRLKSERVQGEERQGEAEGREAGPLREVEFRFSRTPAALQFASVAAIGAFLFGLDPRLHCADGRVRVWFPSHPEAVALDLVAADGAAAFLRRLEVLARELAGSSRERATR
jgi:hypothetical protein